MWPASRYNRSVLLLALRFEDLGSKSLENIGEMVRVYQPRQGHRVVEVRPAPDPNAADMQANAAYLRAALREPQGCVRAGRS
jgi:hypothetical protein